MTNREPTPAEAARLTVAGYMRVAVAGAHMYLCPGGGQVLNLEQALARLDAEEAAA
jgi:hypothetical protein